MYFFVLLIFFHLLNLIVTPVRFVNHIINQFWILTWLDCQSCEVKFWQFRHNVVQSTQPVPTQSAKSVGIRCTTRNADDAIAPDGPGWLWTGDGIQSRSLRDVSTEHADESWRRMGSSDASYSSHGRHESTRSGSCKSFDRLLVD